MSNPGESLQGELLQVLEYIKELNSVLIEFQKENLVLREVIDKLYKHSKGLVYKQSNDR